MPGELFHTIVSGTNAPFRRNTDIAESQEFERSLAEFRKDIRESYEDPDKINWSDEKTMRAVLGKQPG